MAPLQQSLSSFLSSKKKRDDPKVLDGLAVRSSKKQRRQQKLPPPATSRFLGQNKSSRFGECPICEASIPLHRLLVHTETCEGKQDKKNKKMPAEATRENATQATNEKTSTEEQNTTPKQEEWWKKAMTPAKRVIENPILPSDEPIPGLFTYEDFLTPQEEATIMEYLNSNKGWEFARFNGPHYGQRWGVHCNLRDRYVGAAERPLPPFYFDLILPKLQRLEPMASCCPNEANAVDYRVKEGHHLMDHVDDRQLSKEAIANLSLAGDCFMTFINQRSSAHHQPARKRVLLRRRTLQVLTGRARYDYSHGIRNEDLLSDRRVSVTMRESPLTRR